MMCLQKSTSGIINMVIEDETPMFSKQKVNFAPPERITHMCVSSELIVLAMANGILFRIDLKQPDKHEGDYFSISLDCADCVQSSDPRSG